MKYLVAILFVALAAQAQANLNCFYCQNCDNPFETENAPTQLCGDTTDPTEPSVTIPTGPDSEYPGMEVPVTDQNPIPDAGNPGIEVPLTVAPEVLYLQQLRQKRDTAEENTVYNCFTVTEGENTNRGCVVYQGNRDATCALIKTGDGECTLCTGELCNSASGFTISLVTLLAASIFALKF